MLRMKMMTTILLMVVLSACNSKEVKTGSENTKSGDSVEQSENLKTARQHILFFGTSLTAGYGLDDVSQAYPALIQEKIDSLDLPYQVINAGLSGETSAGGKTRVDWLLKQPIDILVLELGANDGLRGLSVEQTRSNLQDIIDRVRTKYPKAKLVLAGMQMPPSMGEQYTGDFKKLFVDLAKKNEMVFVPFLLEGVGGIPKLNQKDGIHPTAEGQKILAANVWARLKPLL